MTSTSTSETTAVRIDQASPDRPRVHFSPKRNWMNDPNGLIVHDGLYHLFFQHNPLGVEWGNMSWGHATSTDLIQWDEGPLALRFDATEGVYSGSVVFDSGNSSGLGSDDAPPLVAIYTSAAADGQAQAVASSTDGGVTWIKHGIVLDRGTTDFRDPKVFRYDGHWILVAVEALDRQLHLYRSADLRHWTHLSTFGPFGAPEGMWECPDLFPLDGRWIVTLSVNPGHPSGGSGMQYFVGDFDGVRFTAERWDWLDRGTDFYAGVTFNDADDRVMIAWLNNWSYAHELPPASWRGSMALPRRLALSNGRLRQSPAITPDEALLHEAHDLLLSTLPHRVPAEATSAAARIRLAVRPGAEEVSIGIRQAGDGTCAAVVAYRDGALTITRHVPARFQSDRLGRFECTSRAAVVLPDTGVLELDIWTDVNSVEIFAQGGLVTASHLLIADPLDIGMELSATGSTAVVEHLTVSALLTMPG